MELFEYLEKTAETVDMTLHRHYGSVYGELYKASAHLLLAGGKRLRPAVLLLSADAVNHGRSDDLIPAALAMELIHTFTLIHDDIMDEDKERRGVPTVHVEWDEPTAILAGDVLYANAFEFLCRSMTDDRSRVKAITMLARTCAQICEGQHMDMSFERRRDVTVAEYLEMVQKKTGALYGASAAIGGMLAGGNAVQVNALYAYGLSAGVAFQIQDDLIDMAEHSEKIGKDRGSDIREGKQTLISIKAQEKGLDLSKFQKKITNEEMDRLVADLHKRGVLSEVRAVAEEHANAAKASLNILPASEERGLLKDIVDYFISRGH
ncbi:MAG TPA: polyprenyl synthetase family protein [Methanomicrobiales archaeon]|nr:polyprenyl synthetase family protein [Methanomicrobiales archaeon]